MHDTFSTISTSGIIEDWSDRRPFVLAQEKKEICSGLAALWVCQVMSPN